jgi:hypothetical protein
MNHSFIIAIPSYKRPQICNDKTLTMLKKNKINPEKIFVYVADDKEYRDYQKHLNPSFYQKLIIGKKGLAEQRQTITEQWPENTNIIFLDDDVDSVDLSLSSTYKKNTLEYFFNDAFKQCREHKSFIWSVYPVFNPFFRKPRPEFVYNHLVFLVGTFYGIINRPSLKSIQLTLTSSHNSQKEDTERTIKYFKEDGVVLRFDKIGFTTKFYGKEGGLGNFESRVKPSAIVSELLKKEYPEYGSISVRKNGIHEFRLKRIPSAFFVPILPKNKTLKKKK